MSEQKKASVNSIANFIDLNFDIEEYEHAYTFGSTYTYFENIIKQYLEQLKK